MDRKALVPAPPPGEGTKPHPRMSTRAATWLVVVAGLLVVYHYAHGGALPSANVPVIAPALHVALRGEVTTVTASKLVVRVEDTQGGLTNLNRTIALGPTTHYQSPGQPSISGAHGLTYIKPGYRVLVHGLSASDGQTVNAAQVSVSFPPVTGTLQSIAGSDLVVSVRGQAQPMVIQASSRTAFFVPNGRWSTLASGVPVRVWIAPEPKDPQHFNALTVTVQPR